MKYKILLHKNVEKFLKKRNFKEREEILKKINLLSVNPHNNPELDISLLKGFYDTYRLRYKNYRIIYRVRDDLLLIFLLKAGNRGDIYKK